MYSCGRVKWIWVCLLYTSDAADERSSVDLGGRNLKQLKDSLKSVDVDMTTELKDRISALSPEPTIATDRNEEKTKHNYGQR